MVMAMSKGALLAVCERLEADYRDRFIAAGASAFNAWANATTFGVEALYGTGIGPAWNASVSYARREGPFGLFGPARPLKTLQEAEHELREQIERQLESGRRPRVFGR
jgi:hypothetical protein